MRSKYRRRAIPPPSRPPRRASQALTVMALLVIGAAVALSAQWLATNAAGPATATAAPSGPEAAAASPQASASPSTSTAPSASPSPAAPLLEAAMPRVINGTTLTIQSTTNATSLGGDPGSRALSAAVTSLGKKPNDLEIAEAYDPNGALTLTVLGFRLPGVDPARLRSMVLDTWLAAHSPGVTSTAVTLSGTASTQVSYGDGGPNEYVFSRGDGVFVAVTPDQSLAASAIAAMTGAPSPSPSGG